MLIEAKNVSKVYSDTAKPVHVLSDLNFSLSKGELVGVFGASGTGKSTFLHIIGGLDNPSSGRVEYEGEEVFKMKEKELSNFRNRHVGFVFQFYHLLAEFSALENVMLPVLIAGMSRKDAFAKAKEALLIVGLGSRLEHLPSMLSGGEQQRVALARAAVMKPPVILADEPTGNLDSSSGGQVLEFLLGLNKNAGIAMVIVTHNRELLSKLDKCYELKDGKLNLI